MIFSDENSTVHCPIKILFSVLCFVLPYWSFNKEKKFYDYKENGHTELEWTLIWHEVLLRETHKTWPEMPYSFPLCPQQWPVANLGGWRRWPLLIYITVGPARLLWVLVTNTQNPDISVTIFFVVVELFFLGERPKWKYKTQNGNCFWDNCKFYTLCRPVCLNFYCPPPAFALLYNWRWQGKMEYKTQNQKIIWVERYSRRMLIWEIHLMQGTLQQA